MARVTRVAARIAELTRPGGHCVITMNCHNTRFFRSYYARFYKLVDRHHDEIRSLVEKGEPVKLEFDIRNGFDLTISDLSLEPAPKKEPLLAVERISANVASISSGICGLGVAAAARSS